MLVAIFAICESFSSVVPYSIPSCFAIRFTWLSTPYAFLFSRMYMMIVIMKSGIPSGQNSVRAIADIMPNPATFFIFSLLKGGFSMSFGKRIISCLCVFVICFSLFSISVSATAGGALDYIIDNAWGPLTFDKIKGIISAFLADGKTPETATEQDWKNAYDDYVTNVQTNVGTATVINGGVRIYFTATSTYSSAGSPISFFSGGQVFSFAGNGSGQTIGVLLSKVYAPFNATFKYGYSVNFDGNISVASTTLSLVGSSGQVAKGVDMAIQSNNRFDFKLGSGLFSSVGSVWVDLIPYTGVVGDYYNTDIGPNSRVGSITGDFGIIGDGNTIIKSDKNYISITPQQALNYPFLIGRMTTATVLILSSWRASCPQKWSLVMKALPLKRATRFITFIILPRLPLLPTRITISPPSQGSLLVPPPVSRPTPARTTVQAIQSPFPPWVTGGKCSAP